MAITSKDSAGLDNAPVRNRAAAEDGERGTSIIVKEKDQTKFKICQIILPLLSTPILSTVQLTKMENMEVSPASVISGGKRTPGRKRKLKETVRRPVYLGELIIGYETVSVSPTLQKSPMKSVAMPITRRVSKRKKYLSPILRHLGQDKKNTHRASSRSKFENDDDYTTKRLELFGKNEESPSKTIIHLEPSEDMPTMMTIELKVHDDWNPDDKTLMTSIPISGDNPFLQRNYKYVDSTEKTYTDDVLLKEHQQGPLRRLSLEETGSELSPMSSLHDGCSSNNGDDEIIMKSTSINFQEKTTNETSSNSDCHNHPSKFCNICGQEPISIDKPYKTFVQICEDEQHKVNDGKYYSCLTCHQRFSIFELTTHEQECFVDVNEECYIFDKEINGRSHLEEEKAGGYRMVACENCVLAMSNR